MTVHSLQGAALHVDAWTGRISRLKGNRIEYDDSSTQLHARMRAHAGQRNARFRALGRAGGDGRQGMTMNGEIQPEEATRESVLSPVDRVSEMLFGLFMALTFVGAVSVAEAGRAQIRDMFVAALGCNLAWGLVDAVMYLVGTVTDRGRSLMLVHSVRAAADAEAGRRLLERLLSRAAASLVSPAEVEAIRRGII